MRGVVVGRARARRRRPQLFVAPPGADEGAQRRTASQAVGAGDLGCREGCGSVAAVLGARHPPREGGAAVEPHVKLSPPPRGPPRAGPTPPPPRPLRGRPATVLPPPPGRSG